MTCKPVRRGDQYECGQCGRQWDVDDTAPATCEQYRRESRAMDVMADEDRGCADVARYERTRYARAQAMRAIRRLGL